MFEKLNFDEKLNFHPFEISFYILFFILLTNNILNFISQFI